MMKKLAVLSVLFGAVLSFAGLKPEFQAFAPDFLQLREAKGGFHHFIFRVTFAPWAFVCEGDVKVPQGDPELLFDGIDNDEVYVEVAYVPSPIGGSDGEEYQAGIFDMMIFYSDGDDEFPSVIKNLKVSLLPPIASDSWAQSSLSDAQNAFGQPGSVWNVPEYQQAITSASATPLSKAQLLATKKVKADKKMNAANAARNGSSNTATTSTTSKAAVKTAPVSPAKPSSNDGLTLKERRRLAAQGASQVTTTSYSSSSAYNTSDDNDANLTPKERKRRALLKQQLGSH
ncbi:MAG: hypothetical protein M0P13_03080 [Fibrobacteraceae bacterium]|nr:hypothetical protein [Fibrobacteraceae bacterium]